VTAEIPGAGPGAAPRLPDPEGSRAVLIGSDDYSHLGPLPAVANNLRRLRELLGDPAVWGLPTRNCAVVSNPTSPAAVMDTIHEAAATASDMLLVYFAGHGLLDPDTQDLYLALTESSVGRLYSAVRFDDVRREMVAVARATSKVVILDCCYSGRAMAGGMSGSTDVADQARIDGTYLMTASAETVKAQAPEGEEFTAFTGELVTVLGQGVPEGPDFLNLETLYWHVRKELLAKRRPVPQQRAGNNGGMIILGRNRRGVKAQIESGAAAEPTRRPLPEPPAGLEHIMRRPPREIAAEAAMLVANDSPTEARQLLVAAAARRPDQEVVSLIALLRADGREADADMVISAIRERPPIEITALVDLMRRYVSDRDADQLLNAVANGTPENVAACAKILATSAGPAELRQLLDAAILAHRRSEAIVTLVAALSSIGLDAELDRMLDLAAEGLTDTETAALGDALRGAGRDDAAFRLYAAARRSIVRRPSSELASLLQAMRDADQDHDADDLLQEICAAAHGPEQLLELASELWSCSLPADASRLLDSAASTLDAVQVNWLASALREANREDAALSLCLEAAAQRPVTVAMALVMALRDAGRPVDAQRILDSSQSWPARKTGELASSLHRAGAHADVDRILATTATSGPERIVGVIAGAREHAFREATSRMAELAAFNDPTDVAVIIGSLTRQDMGPEAERLLDLSATNSADYQAKVVGGLQQPGLEHCIEYLIRSQARHDLTRVFDYLDTYLQLGLPEVASNLVSELAARPPADITSIAERYFAGNLGQPDILAGPIGRWPVPAVIAVLEVAQAHPGADVRLILSTASHRPPTQTGSLIARLHASQPTLAAEVARLIASDWRPANMHALLGEVARTGTRDSADMLLSAVASYSSESKVTGLHSVLWEAREYAEADHLLASALVARSPDFIDSLAMHAGGLRTLFQDKECLRSAIAQIGARRSPADIQQFYEILIKYQCATEARQLRKHTARTARPKNSMSPFGPPPF
jgi:hypothetical protein